MSLDLAADSIRTCVELGRSPVVVYRVQGGGGVEKPIPPLLCGVVALRVAAVRAAALIVNRAVCFRTTALRLVVAATSGVGRGDLKHRGVRREPARGVVVRAIE